MPRFANVSNRDYEERAQAGARASEEFDQRAFARQNQQRIAAYEQMHIELERAKQERQMVHDQAQTERRLKYEYRMAEAIPKLYAIDPRDPTAQAQRAQFAKEYSDLFHSEKGMPNITSEFEQHARMSQAAQQQATGIDAKSEAADLRSQNAKEAAEVRNQHSIELKQMSEQHAKELEPLKMATQVRGQLSSHQRQLDDAQRVIDHLEKTSAETNEPITSTGIFLDDDGKKRFGFANVEKKDSPLVTPQQEERFNNYKAAITRRDNFQSKVEQGNTRLDQLLSGDAPPVAPGAAATPSPVEPKAAGDEAPPVNPNLTSTPPVAPVVPAPPAGGISMAAGAADGMFAGLPSQTPPVAVAQPTPVAPVAANAPDPHQMALDWATANPNDPRAAKIKALHGTQ